MQEFHRQLFAHSAASLREEIKRITGVQVREAVAEIETTTGTVVHVFTSGTMVQVFQLAEGIPAETWNARGSPQKAREAMKEIKMTTPKNRTCREVFYSIRDSGTRWAFEVMGDAGWAITRNGTRVAVGTADLESVRAGVAKFKTLTQPPEETSPCDPVVLERLDRIEGQIPSVIKSKGRAQRQVKMVEP